MSLMTDLKFHSSSRQCAFACFQTQIVSEYVCIHIHIVVSEIVYIVCEYVCYPILQLRKVLQSALTWAMGTLVRHIQPSNIAA